MTYPQGIAYRKETCQWGSESLKPGEECWPAEKRGHSASPAKKRALARNVSLFDGTARCISRRLSPKLMAFLLSLVLANTVLFSSFLEQEWSGLE